MVDGPGGWPSLTSHGPGLVAFADEAARLAAAVVAGGALGLNRNLRGKAAGLRTHALVALGAAAAVVAAAHSGDGAAASRVMQGIITGVGFLGAGVILHPAKDGAGQPATAGRREVRGLTTAASLWFAAVLGLAAGGGLWSLTLLAAALTLMILVLGGGVEDAVRRRMLAAGRRRRRRTRDGSPVTAEPRRVTRDGGPATGGT